MLWEGKKLIRKRRTMRGSSYLRFSIEAFPIFKRAWHFNLILGITEKIKTFSACWQSLTQGCRCGVWWSNHSDLESRAKPADIGGGDYVESK